MKSTEQFITEQFNVEGTFISGEKYGSGHINDTKLVVMENEGKITRYILQKINKNVFKDPASLMNNYAAVTEYLRKIIEANGGDAMRETLNLIKTRDGMNYYVDENGDFWRMLVFVEDSMSFDKVERPEQFYLSAVAFGNFQYLLRDYPADTLAETIVNFHNTPDRVRQLCEAVEKDSCNRLSEVKDEVDFVLSRKAFTETFENARKEGKLPLRVTHNDTKINNILFDILEIF